MHYKILLLFYVIEINADADKENNTLLMRDKKSKFLLFCKEICFYLLFCVFHNPLHRDSFIFSLSNLILFNNENLQLNFNSWVEIKITTNNEKALKYRKAKNRSKFGKEKKMYRKRIISEMYKYGTA